LVSILPCGSANLQKVKWKIVVGHTFFPSNERKQNLFVSLDMDISFFAAALSFFSSSLIKCSVKTLGAFLSRHHLYLLYILFRLLLPLMPFTAMTALPHGDCASAADEQTTNAQTTENS
jgi:hypothetical protein